MSQYFIVTETEGAHDGGSNLAESDTMAPALAMKDEGFGGFLHLKS